MLFNFKFKLLTIVLLLLATCTFAQTGIGTITPNASAKLDVYSDNKGFLPPRVTLTSATDNTTVPNAAEGLLVYNKGSVGLQAGYYYWNGANWATIATATSAGNGVTSMDMVKLYSKAYSTATGDIANTNGFSFTVPISGRYAFDFTSSGYATGDFTMTFKVRQGTTDLGTDAQSSANNTVHVEYNGKVEVNLQAGTTYNVIVLTTGTRNTGDYDRVYYKMVAGNLPVTGQTVDYGIARYTGADGSSLANGAIVSFDATAVGNLTWSSNKFTLKANRTYEIESGLSIFHGTGAGVAGRFQIYDYTNSIALAYSLLMSQNGAGSYAQSANTPMKCIITPTTDIQVGVRMLDFYGPATGPGIIGNAVQTGSSSSPNASYFMVKQIGSSAIVNPWILNGTDVYNITGEVGIGTNAPAYSLDINGTAKLATTPSITTATNVLVKDPTTSQISEQPISYITGVAKFILNAAQAVSAGSTIVFNTTSNNTISNYVSLNTSTGVMTLQTGTYELNASAGALNAGTGNNGDTRVYSMFHNGTAYVGSGGVSETGPAGNWNGMPQNNANYIITVPVGQTAQISFKALIVTNVSSLSVTGDFGNVGDAGRAWVVVRKYN